MVSLLLESGANVNAVNSVGRTASQMAAFVGQHSTVSIINNFISCDEIDYFTQIHGLEKEPKLPLSVVSPLHSMVCLTNIHPIKIALFLKDHWTLIDHGKNVTEILEILCMKQFKSNEDIKCSNQCSRDSQSITHVEYV